ncbi:mechanosensitive ion channel family protein [Halorubellus sp. PRR65]|uniref:mechanosensitive ion channel family protein n=1 Tax=Halorubellus sp. PRR65 TaxID=3098148 RepID=UPI002B257720|nr:mechanosensitive ion channel family protein [Halorubellus sp. PRR65]
MKRPVGYGSLLGAAAVFVAVNVLRTTWEVSPGNEAVRANALKAGVALAVALAVYGTYLLTLQAVRRWTDDERRKHDVRNVLRLSFGLVGVVGVAGAFTEEWLGVLFSLGIAGFAVTFALQTPIVSLLGWVYIMAKRPYQVGDRVRIEDARGDVAEIDFLTTTLWEVHGDLVASHQPSGRLVTVPNAVVLESQVFNYTDDSFPYVWTETTIQISYETDLDFARETARRVVDDYLGEEMERRVDRYRDSLAETPVELAVESRPSVNVEQAESWVELHVRYLVDPKAMQATENEVLVRVLDAFAEHPDRVGYPVGRFR